MSDATPQETTVLSKPCGSLCWIFGIGSGPVTPIGCVEADGHDGEHRTTIEIAKPSARFTVTWIDGFS